MSLKRTVSSTPTEVFDDALAEPCLDAPIIKGGFAGHATNAPDPDESRRSMR